MTHHCILPQQFVRFMWLSAGACPVFVAATEHKIQVHIQTQTVLISCLVSSVYARIVASFPGRSRLQFLIAYCTVCDQKLEAGTAWERGYPYCAPITSGSVPFLSIPGFPASQSMPALTAYMNNVLQALQS